MDTRTRVELDVREISDRLTRIAMQYMPSEFTVTEARFFCAAADALYGWCNAMDEVRKEGEPQ
jgi:hypothetical protein